MTKADNEKNGFKTLKEVSEYYCCSTKTLLRWMAVLSYERLPSGRSHVLIDFVEFEKRADEYNKTHKPLFVKR